MQMTTKKLWVENAGRHPGSAKKQKINARKSDSTPGIVAYIGQLSP
jgi:hypothetical protein